MTPQSIMITGVAVSVAIHLILRYTKRPSYEGLILFLILIFLSAAGWVVGFAIGGWKGMGYSALAMMVMMASMAGLVTSFIWSLLVKE
ncbi:YesK family protein [Rossellomorea marisflavi]|uniref:YesK family protein n=1 Tax=Rossellomorea marisflavi TaxID=189381 RepID=UPI00296EBA23|nr:YesK family protein [Rossellomorea marisflavi]MDW4525299.1 YesK family protein [Rossellomorea marisflavi]